MSHEFECWAPASDYEGFYEVSTLGRIRRTESGRLRTLSLAQGRKYINVCLSGGGQAATPDVHRLVAQAFVPNPENKPMVNHIDGDKMNNRASNLEWSTQVENSVHAVDLGLIKSGTRAYNSRLNDDAVKEMRRLHQTGVSYADLGRAYGVDGSTVSSAVRRVTWKHVH